MKTKPKHTKTCKCSECGAPEVKRKIGRTIVTNICHILGLCGVCVAKQAGL